MSDTPRIGDKVRVSAEGTYKPSGCGQFNVTCEDGSLIILHGDGKPWDVEVVEPAIPKDEYPVRTVLYCDDYCPTVVKRSNGDWYCVEHKEESMWADMAFNHTVKYRPDQPDKHNGHSAKHWHNRWKRAGKHNVELQDKLGEYRRKIKDLEKNAENEKQPRTVTTEAEYEALPLGSVVALAYGGGVYERGRSALWFAAGYNDGEPSRYLAGTTRTVLREGWGNE